MQASWTWYLGLLDLNFRIYRAFSLLAATLRQSSHPPLSGGISNRCYGVSLLPSFDTLRSTASGRAGSLPARPSDLQRKSWGRLRRSTALTAKLDIHAYIHPYIHSCIYAYILINSYVPLNPLYFDKYILVVSV